jgi:hypothetical protein
MSELLQRKFRVGQWVGVICADADKPENEDNVCWIGRIVRFFPRRLEVLLQPACRISSDGVWDYCGTSEFETRKYGSSTSVWAVNYAEKTYRYLFPECFPLRVVEDGNLIYVNAPSKDDITRDKVYYRPDPFTRTLRAGDKYSETEHDKTAYNRMWLKVLKGLNGIKFLHLDDTGLGTTRATLSKFPRAHITVPNPYEYHNIKCHAALHPTLRHANIHVEPSLLEHVLRKANSFFDAISIDGCASIYGNSRVKPLRDYRLALRHLRRGGRIAITLSKRTAGGKSGLTEHDLDDTVQLLQRPGYGLRAKLIGKPLSNSKNNTVSFFLKRVD